MEKLNSLFIKRVIFICAIMVIAGVSYIYMNTKYDPLSRYPYELTEAQHDRIVKGLTNNEINYIIEYSIDPQEFLPFVGCTGYNIYRMNDYMNVYQFHPELAPQLIVDFYNTIVSVYKEDVTSQLQGYYVHEVIDYYIDNPKAGKLVLNAMDYSLVVNKKNSVGYYEPKDLVTTKFNAKENQFQLRKDAADALDSLYSSMKAALKKPAVAHLMIERAYDDYQTLNTKDGSAFGTNDFQLGLSVRFAMDNKDVFDNSSAAEWIANNAHMFGFVCYSKKDTAHYRYVGVNTAYEVYSKNIYFEDYK